MVENNEHPQVKRTTLNELVSRATVLDRIHRRQMYSGRTSVHERLTTHDQPPRGQHYRPSYEKPLDKGTSRPKDSMDLDSVQVKESRIDRNKRYMVEGQCFNCSEKGHVTADCPRKPDRTPRPAARIHLTTLKRKEQETLPKQQDEDSEDGTAYLEPHDTVELTGHVGKHKVIILCDNGATNFFVR